MTTLPTTTNEIQTVVPPRRLSRSLRPRGLWGQLNLLVLQPGAFFSTLQPLHQERQWLWVAVLLLALVSFNAVRQNSAAASPTQPEIPVPLDMGGEFPMDSGPLPDMGFIPENAAPFPGESAGTEDVSSNWAKALVAGTTLLLHWLVLSGLLAEVSMFRGMRPQMGKNLQIAIWASVPLAFMIGVQLVYQGAGGSLGQPGLTGLLVESETYQQMPGFLQNIAWSLAANITLFWLWSLVLIYIGARHALRGQRWAVLLTLAAWVVVLTVVPVLTGAVAAPQPELEEMAPPMFEMLPEDMTQPEAGEDEFTRPERPPADVVEPGIAG